MTLLQGANAAWLRHQSITTADDIPDHCHRGYAVPPAKKLVSHCWSHGADHRAYEWSPQLDPFWSPEQIAAYINGYCGVPLEFPA